MHLYFDLIEKIPSFKTYDTFGEDHYIEFGNSPLGSIGYWLNDLSVNREQNEKVIKKVCGYLNDTFKNAENFRGEVINDFQVYLFGVLDYPTINCIRPYLDPAILDLGRKYLKGIDGENYQEF